jgi:hypothetical protein
MTSVPALNTMEWFSESARLFFPLPMQNKYLTSKVLIDFEIIPLLMK